MSSLALDAEALYGELQRGVRPLLTPETRLVGIVSGGQWLAERLQADLGLPGAAGALSSAMHRDDYAKRGLAASGHCLLMCGGIAGASGVVAMPGHALPHDFSSA